jgi:hypothetical protein
MSGLARFASLCALTTAWATAWVLPAAAMAADPIAPAPHEGLVVIAVSGPDEFGRGYSLLWRPLAGEARCPVLATHGGFSAPGTGHEGQPWRFRVVRVRPGRYALGSIGWVRMGFMVLSGEEPAAGARPVISVADGETVYAGAFRLRETTPRHPTAEAVTNVAIAEVNAAKLTAQPAVDRSGQKAEVAGAGCK